MSDAKQPTPRRGPRLALRALPLALLALAVAAAASPGFTLKLDELDTKTLARTSEDEPAYWVDRMEQALLPRASLRAKFVLHSRAPGRPPHRQAGSLVRVEGPASIRSILSVEEPGDERRALKVTSRSRGRALRDLYLAPGDPPLPLDVAASDPVLQTPLTYEDLGFVPLDHRIGSDVEPEAGRDGSVLRLSSGPYGGYGRVVTRIDRETALPIEVEFFDARGRLLRRVTYADVDRDGPYAFPLRIEATDVRTGASATLEFSEVEIGPPIYEFEFSDAHLRRALRGAR